MHSRKFDMSFFLNKTILAGVIGMVLVSCNATKETRVQQPAVVALPPANPCQDKICIDTLQTRYLFGKWYDFTPNFFTEQADYVAYYVKTSTDLRDSAAHSGTFTFHENFTFEQSYPINDTTTLTKKGSWKIDAKTRRLILTVPEGMHAPTLTIVELNRNILILKYGL